MTRRSVFALLLISRIVRAAPAQESVRGSLGDAATLKTADGKTIHLDGDESTRAVIADERLRGMDFEALGHFTGADKFQIDPIHERAMFIHKDGKRLFITYWCNVCYIRTYVPGNCRCCQKYTDLDLTENDAQ